MNMMLNKSAEEISLTYFNDFEKENYPLRLAYYKDNKYFYKGKFSVQTNGIGETRSFRAYINDFTKRFKPDLISKEKDLWISLKDNGEFVVRKGRTGEETKNLTDEDLFMYNLLCFLSLVRFWDEFNAIRDVNTIKLTIVIKLPDNCHFDVDCIVDRIKEMNRIAFVI